MFDEATVRAAAAVAARLNVELAALLAVAEIESGGKAFARVNGKNEPLIRFEGHYFDRRLTAAQRKKARADGLSSPTAGAVKNPAKQEDRWKLLNRAILINSNAALESVSWGLGQVMGAHWKALGYGSVSELVNECRASVAGQIEVMARFIEKNGLAGHLRKKDWAKFARAYNGPAYKQNAYDTKMASAYARWSKAKSTPTVEPGSTPPVTTPTRTDSILARGHRGPIIADLQHALNTLGYGPLKVDEHFGENTEKAVMSFQLDNGLKVDGIAGGRTSTAIGKAIADKELKPAIEKAEQKAEEAEQKVVEAEKTVPETAREEVKEKTSFWSWLLGALGVGGGGLSAISGAQWQTVVAIGGVAVVALVVMLIMRRQIIEAFKDINREAKS